MASALTKRGGEKTRGGEKESRPGWEMGTLERRDS